MVLQSEMLLQALTEDAYGGNTVCGGKRRDRKNSFIFGYCIQYQDMNTQNRENFMDSGTGFKL